MGFARQESVSSAVASGPKELVTLCRGIVVEARKFSSSSKGGEGRPRSQKSRRRGANASSVSRDDRDRGQRKSTSGV